MSRSPEPPAQDPGARASEASRLLELGRLAPMDGPVDAVLADAVGLVSELLDVPSSLVTVIDAEHQHVRAAVGFPDSPLRRPDAFCDHTIRQRGVLVVPDASQDPRFAENPLVTGDQHLRFYAGAPLVTSSGHAMGALCAIDEKPRGVTPSEEALLTVLADQVATHLEVRAMDRHRVGSRDRSDEGVPELEQVVKASALGYLALDADGRITEVNPAVCRIFGYRAGELLGTTGDQLRRRDHHPSGHPDQHRRPAGVRPRRVAGRPGRAPQGRVVSHLAPFVEGTHVFRHRLGHEVLVRCLVGRLPAASGPAPRAVVLLKDLTAKVAALSDLLLAERGRQSVLETATDAYIRIDRRGEVREWNLAAGALFGYRAEEVVGRSLSELIVPTHLAGAHDRGVERAASGGAPSLEGQVLELPARHKDGHELLIELTVWSTPGEDGSISFQAFCRDIGERVASQEAVRAANADLTAANTALAESRQQLRAAFEASPTADAVVDADGLLVEVNAALCRYLAAEPADLVGRSWVSLFHDADPREAMDAVIRVLSTGEAVTRREVRCLRMDGRVVWGLLSLIAMSGDTRTGRLMLRIEDTSAHKELEGMLVRQISEDPVTGLASRMLFLERVRDAVASADDAPVAVAVLVVKGLNTIIDRDGYAAGDQVLAALAGRMSSGLDTEVTFAHLQPGVFAILVRQGPLVAARLAERLLGAFGDGVRADSARTSLRGYVGISTTEPPTPGGAPSAEQPASSTVGRLVQDAEAAARKAAADGTRSVAYASAEMREAQEYQHRMEVLIRDALEQDTVRVAYQPVYDLATGAMVAVEALLRTTDSSGRPVPPLHLVPVAEKSGQIVDVGRRVLRLAAEQAARWRDEHGVLLPVAVNVSAVQLERADFLDDVLRAVRRAGVPPEAVSLELTESVLLTSGSAGISKLRDLRDAGVKLAIDDFGTGYASLSYLRDLPASTVKIDRSFVEGIPGDRAAVAIVTGIIGLAQNFSMTCIAEGIENDDQLAYLAQRGVCGQGHLLGRPADGAEIGRLLAASSSRPDSKGRP